jgi:TRAP-type mannitol/chloroaromatic compound transport system permease large subunit
VLFPSSAAAVGAVGALAIGLARRRLSWPSLRQCLEETASITAVMFLIIIGGLMLSRFLVSSGFIVEIEELLREFNLSKNQFLFTVIIVYLLMGMFIDSISIMVVTMPILYPLLKPIGIDPVWFGVLVVKLIELSTITPPVGLNLFAVLSASEGRVSTRDIYTGVAPFIVLEIFVLALLVLVPSLSLWLPSQMMGR